MTQQITGADIVRALEERKALLQEKKKEKKLDFEKALQEKEEYDDEQCENPLEVLASWMEIDSELDDIRDQLDTMKHPDEDAFMAEIKEREAFAKNFD